MEEEIRSILKESIAVKEKLCRDDLIASIEKLAEAAVTCLRKGGKVILFGNGGSAADSQHIAAELVGRFTRERKALAAIALSCNSSNLTSISNDYGFKEVFARQIEGLGRNADLAIGISTSGSSPNVLAGISCAKAMGMRTACLTGEGGGELAKKVDLSVCVPSKNTARIQEAHITIGHIICELTEKAFL
ncbi:MAG: D-sedoheptulose 7-phosphate isomerase [Candidatus Omnitrophica bacterium]|nr:D-sedoheptulose 7-phosphate isomerase [Candidatus Omnitrophota bacterium]MBU3933933.1 D-sedoheptulose 7-phosphate isomerase [Candidatus Omnitrophota bacterium]MBU4141162.1 D-sedoheptulose 7-phosphate isomerase [Candidatus Omnitrophota bacterium]